MWRRGTGLGSPVDPEECRYITISSRANPVGEGYGGNLTGSFTARMEGKT